MTLRGNPKVLFILVFLFSLIVLKYSYSSYSLSGVNKLKELCELDSELTIYETIQSQGFFDSTTDCHHCWKDLVLFPYTYVEFCDEDSYRHPASYVLSGNGCYRLTEIDKNKNKCHSGVRAELENYSVEPFESFREKSCVKVQNIDSPGSTVGLFLDEKLVHLSDEFDIYRIEYTIEEINRNKIYGKLVNYSLNKKTLNGAQYGCSSSKVSGENLTLQDPSLYGVFINKVIISN